MTDRMKDVVVGVVIIIVAYGAILFMGGCSSPPKPVPAPPEREALNNAQDGAKDFAVIGEALRRILEQVERGRKALDQ